MLTEIDNVRTELGAKGQTSNAFDSIKKLSTLVADLKKTADEMLLNKPDAQKIEKNIVDTVVKTANETAKSMGIKMDEVKTLSESQVKDGDLVKEKLNEIKSILEALAQAKGENRVVVKSWFETEETNKK